MQQTQAGPVLGVDTTRVPGAHASEQTQDCRHQMRGNALGSIVVVELLERKNALDRIKKSLKGTDDLTCPHTHAQMYKYI